MNTDSIFEKAKSVLILPSSDKIKDKNGPPRRDPSSSEMIKKDVLGISDIVFKGSDSKAIFGYFLWFN